MDLGIYPKLSIHKLMSGSNSASLQIKVMNGPEIMVCKSEPHRLKEQGMTVFEAQGAKEPIIDIKGSDKLPFGAARLGIFEFDVFDCSSKKKIGTLTREAPKLFQRAVWYLEDARGAEIGSVSEINAVVAVLHELGLFPIIPKAYDVRLGDNHVAKISRMSMIDVIWLDLSDDLNGRLDRRLGLAAGIVLCLVGK